MRRIHTLSTAMLLLAGIVAVGCKPSEPAPTPVMPTTMTAPETNGNVGTPTTLPVPPAAQTIVAIPAATPPAAKDLTHSVTVDQPYFLNEPGADPKPIGTLKAGSKVLVMVPGAIYSQVVTDKGITAFTPTAGLQPLGK